MTSFSANFWGRYYDALSCIECLKKVMRGMTWFLLSAILLLATAQTSYAQNQVVTVDSVTRVPDKQLPFDEKFVLKIPIAYSEVGGDGVKYIELGRNRTFVQTLQQRNDQYKTDVEKWERTGTGTKPDPLTYYDIKRIASYKTSKTGKHNYLIIDVDGDNKLSPGTAYTYFWSGEASEPIITLFDQFDVYNAYKTTAPGSPEAIAAKAQVVNQFNDIARQNLKDFGIEIYFQKTETDDTGGTLFRNSLEKWYADVPYSAFHDTLSEYQSSVSTQPFTPLTAAESAACQMLTDKILGISNQIDSQWKNAYFPDQRRTVQRLVNLKQMKLVDFQRLLLGLTSLDCDACVSVKSTQIPLRQANLKTTLKGLNELYTIAQALSDPPARLKVFADRLNAYIQQVQALDRQFLKVVRARKRVISGITAIGVSNVSTLTTGTDIYSFETRTKLSIAPDFGLTTTFFDKGSNPYPFVPYLGFHVNLRPINRDVPFRSYRHTFAGRLSVMVAWSLVSIDNGPNVTRNAMQDSVSGFFKSKTLLLGTGYRLGNAARITTGAMFYFDYPTMGTQPVVYNKRNLRAWPYIGLSLDLALKDLLNGITDVFGSAPRAYSPLPATVTAVP